jgi:hypothetical protein
MMKETTVVLRIKYDPRHDEDPSKWIWHELIDCLPEDAVLVSTTPDSDELREALRGLFKTFDAANEIGMITWNATPLRDARAKAEATCVRVGVL